MISILREEKEVIMFRHMPALIPHSPAPLILRSCRPPIPDSTGSRPRRISLPSGSGLSSCYRPIAIAGSAGIPNSQGIVTQSHVTGLNKSGKDVIIRHNKATVFIADIVAEYFDSLTPVNDNGLISVEPISKFDD